MNHQYQENIKYCVHSSLPSSSKIIAERNGKHPNFSIQPRQQSFRNKSCLFHFIETRHGPKLLFSSMNVISVLMHLQVWFREFEGDIASCELLVDSSECINLWDKRNSLALVRYFGQCSVFFNIPKRNPLENAEILKSCSRSCLTLVKQLKCINK